MKATKSEINKISKYLWKQGHGSKKELATSLGFEQTELSRLLKGGTISEDKLANILAIVSDAK